MSFHLAIKTLLSGLKSLLPPSGSSSLLLHHQGQVQGSSAQTSPASVAVWISMSHKSWWVSEWVKSLSHVRLFATPWTVAYQAPPSMGFSRHECWSGLPFVSPGDLPDPGIEPGSPILHLLVAPHLSVFWRVCLWSVSPPEFKLGGSAHALKQPWPYVSSPVYVVAIFPHFTAPRHLHRLPPVISPQIHPAFKKNACKS